MDRDYNGDEVGGADEDGCDSIEKMSCKRGQINAL
jgi:hypothetical protein